MPTVPPGAVKGSGEPIPMTKMPTADAAPREPTRATPIQPLRGPRAETPASPPPPIAPLRPENPVPVRAARGGPPPVATGSPEPPCAATNVSWVWVYDKLSSAIRIRHYSPKTLEVYKFWTQRLQTYTRSKDPNSVSMEDVKGFLNFLAVEKQVSASSQNQAFNALLFLFRHVLEKEFGRVEGVVRAKRRPYIPVVLSREEVDRIIRHLDPPYDLVGKLLYGCGLRLFECLID